jgi:hypothetical protein
MTRALICGGLPGSSHARSTRDLISPLRCAAAGVTELTGHPAIRLSRKSWALTRHMRRGGFAGGLKLRELIYMPPVLLRGVTCTLPLRHATSCWVPVL